MLQGHPILEIRVRVGEIYPRTYSMIRGQGTNLEVIGKMDGSPWLHLKCAGCTALKYVLSKTQSVVDTAV